MLNPLTNDEKLRLLRFMCAFAWSDLQISAREREFVVGLIGRLGLSPDDAGRAVRWLDHPPAEEELDPSDIPPEHRRLFLEAALEMVSKDGVIDALEAENFAIFEALVDVGGGWDEE